MGRQVVFRPPPPTESRVNPHKPPRDTRLRNRLFFATVIAAIVVGLWLAR